MEDFTAQELIHEFVAEALESLREVPRLLDHFRQDATQIEALHAAFRAIHSIKGTAACLGLDAYKLFAHGLENLLAQIRDGKTPLSETLWEILIEGIDLLEGMLGSAGEGRIRQHLGPAEEALLARLPWAVCSASSPGASRAGSEVAAQAIQEVSEEIGSPGAVPHPVSFPSQQPANLSAAACSAPPSQPVPAAFQ